MSADFWPDEAETDAAIAFHDEDADFLPENEPALSQWIQKVIDQEKGQLQQINYIFCSDEYLHRINLEYLDHDTYTDIITFPYEDPPLIHSDIFISVERVRENASDLGVSFEKELHRVIIHGVLHLCGYPDKTPVEAQRMREREDKALELFSTQSNEEYPS
jgi:rRNA maturation RNase YbeY